MRDTVHTAPDQPTPDRRGQRGSALVLAAFVLVLLSAMGIGLMFTAKVEMSSGLSSLEVKKAFFMAEAGQEDGRMTLFNTNGVGSFDDDLAAAAGGDGVIDFDLDALELTYGTDGRPNGVTGFDDDVPVRTFTSLNGGWYAAFVTNDPVDGPTNLTDSNDRVMITAIGASEDNAQEKVQAIVERYEVLPAMPPATITLLGPPPTFEGGHADVHEYSGDDCQGSGQPGLYVPIVGTIGSASEAAAELGMHVTIDEDTGVEDGPDYESGPYRNEDTFADLTDISEPTVHGSLDPAWTDCAAVVQMIEDTRAAADVVCCTPPVCSTPTPDPCTIPASTPGRTIFIDGDYDIGPGDSGDGTILVTGEMRYDGRASWRGLLLAFGAGEFERHGGGNGTITGAIMVADVAGPDNIYGTADDCTGPDNGFSSTYFDLSGGGNAHTLYCTNDILANKPKPPYRIVGFRQD
jgi:hypothetical protein